MPVGAAYYNEHDAFTAAWLRELIKDGLIADGEVDERDIKDVRAGDLGGFAQCHFFAGIGGWSYALRLAGWPDDRHVWTGSCPCQPFSVAGRGHGEADARHLWPIWHALIQECRPTVVFGEQVAGATALSWLDAVLPDLEDDGYAVAAADLCAAGVGAPHARQRLWFVGDMCWADANGGEADWRDIDLQVRRERCVTDNETPYDAPRTLWPYQSRPPIVADGISARVELVCGYGNAIVPQVAAEFIAAYMEARCQT